MTTYTTKVAANGYTVLYYSTETGKRIAKKTALENERNYIISNGTRAARYDLAVDAVNFEPWASDGTCGLWKVWVIRDGLGRFESHGDRAAQQKLAEFNLTLNDFADEQRARNLNSTMKYIIEYYAVSTEAQELAIDAEIAN